MKPEDDCCFDWKKAIKEWEKEHKLPIKDHKILETKPGVYTDGMGLFVAID